MATVKANNPLLGSKQREVAKRVLASGFSRDDFRFIELQARQNITALLHQSGRYRFDFYPGEDWVVNYSPAEHTAESGEVGVGDWEYVLTRVDWWLSYIKREEDVTDPWAAFAESVEPFNLGGDTDGDDTPFSEEERETVKRQLDEVKVYLLDHAAKSEEDHHAIIDSLNRANDELAKNRGRVEWRTFLLGILFELMLFGYATPEGVRHVLTVLLAEGQHLLR